MNHVVARQREKDAYPSSGRYLVQRDQQEMRTATGASRE